MANFSHGRADVSQADDAQRLACQFWQGSVPVAEVGFAAPDALARSFGVVGHVVGDVEDVGKHHLRHRVGAVGGYVGDDDAMLASCHNVDDVESCSQYADILQAWKLAEQYIVESHLVGEDDLSLFGPFHDFLACGAGIYGQFAKLF